MKNQLLALLCAIITGLSLCFLSAIYLSENIQYQIGIPIAAISIIVYMVIEEELDR